MLAGKGQGVWTGEIIQACAMPTFVFINVACKMKNKECSRIFQQVEIFFPLTIYLKLYVLCKPITLNL